MNSGMNEVSDESIPCTNTGINAFSHEFYTTFFMTSELPQCFGHSGRVVEALVARLQADNGLSLTIGDIAQDLDISKRTLQRKLDAQGTKFSILRDQVRRHYAVLYLMREDLTIGTISNRLDFSDRTSFTNAFKRWMAISPRTFRNLYKSEKPKDVGSGS